MSHLEISVDNVFSMAVPNRLHQLLEKSACSLLAKMADILQHITKRAPVGVLHYYEQFLATFPLYDVVQLNDVRML